MRKVDNTEVEPSIAIVEAKLSGDTIKLMEGGIGRKTIGKKLDRIKNQREKKDSDLTQVELHELIKKYQLDVKNYKFRVVELKEEIMSTN